MQIKHNCRFSLTLAFYGIICSVQNACLRQTNKTSLDSIKAQPKESECAQTISEESWFSQGSSDFEIGFNNFTEDQSPLRFLFGTTKKLSEDRQIFETILSPAKDEPNGKIKPTTIIVERVGFDTLSTCVWPKLKISPQASKDAYKSTKFSADPVFWYSSCQPNAVAALAGEWTAHKILNDLGISAPKMKAGKLIVYGGPTPIVVPGLWTEDAAQICKKNSLALTKIDEDRPVTFGLALRESLLRIMWARSIVADRDYFADGDGTSLTEIQNFEICADSKGVAQIGVAIDLEKSGLVDDALAAQNAREYKINILASSHQDYAAEADLDLTPLKKRRVTDPDFLKFVQSSLAIFNELDQKMACSFDDLDKSEIPFLASEKKPLFLKRIRERYEKFKIKTNIEIEKAKQKGWK